MTIYELKRKVDATGSHFFDRETMKFFGDTLSNFKVSSETINTWSEDNVDCWVVYRIIPSKKGLNNEYYFNKKTFQREFKRRIYEHNEHK